MSLHNPLRKQGKQEDRGRKRILWGMRGWGQNWASFLQSLAWGRLRMDRAAQWGESRRATLVGGGEWEHRGWWRKMMVLVMGEQRCLLCIPCSPEPSMQESSFCSPSLTWCHGRSQCSAGEGVLEKSPTRAGFKRGLDYFRASQKTGGYVRSNLSKCNQISVLSWSPSRVLGVIYSSIPPCVVTFFWNSQSWSWD